MIGLMTDSGHPNKRDDGPHTLGASEAKPRRGGAQRPTHNQPNQENRFPFLNFLCFAPYLSHWYHLPVRYLHLLKSALQFISSRRKSRGIVSTICSITSSPQSITACLLHIERKKRSLEHACFFFADITRLHTLIVALASSLIALIFFNSIENVFFFIRGNS